MRDQQTALRELIGTVKQQRDELALKIHLAEAEAKQEYERLSGKVDDLLHEYEPIKDAVEETAANVASALALAAGELKNGFTRIRKGL